MEDGSAYARRDLAKVAISAAARDFRNRSTLAHPSHAPRTYRLSLAIILTLFVFSVQMLVWDLIEPLVWLLFYPTVFFCAVLTGLEGGIVSTLLATVLGWYFFLPPRYSFQVHNATEWVSIIAFCATGILFSLFSERTKLKTRSKAAEESNRRLRSVLDAAADAVLVADAKGRHIYANHQAASLLGVPIEVLLQTHIVEHVPANRLAATLVSFEQLRTQGRLCTELQLQHRDGTVIAVEVNAVQLPDGNFYGSFRDITERKRSEARLRQAAKVFESTVEGVLVADADVRISAVNRAFCKITGYTEEEVLGKSPRIFKSGRHDQSFYRTLWKSIEETGAWRGEIWDRRKSGEIYPAWMTINAVRDESGKLTNYVSVFSDISDIKQFEERLKFLAQHDPLTQLPNRLLLSDRLERGIQRSKRDAGKLAVLFVDLDSFKKVNDALGHPVGDQLLQAVARRLTDCLRAEDTVARLGGDEFVVVLEGFASVDDISTIATKILQALADPFNLEDEVLFIGASIGISVYPHDGQDSVSLLKNADAAMYQAKEDGRNTFRFYSGKLTSVAREHLRLETALRHAIEQRQFVLHFQPQLQVHTGKISGLEALVRWNHPEDGLISPSQFIPFAEKTGLIVQLGNWVLQAACEQLVNWLHSGLAPMTVAVNLSPRQFLHQDIVELVRDVLQRTQLPPNLLELEITEGAIMERAENAVRSLMGLKSLGVRLSIDDFGTGYSSLSYLRRFPIDALKIDQSFMRDIPQDRSAMQIAATIIAMGHSLGMSVLAEGVETQQQLSFLKVQQCDLYQGYLHSRPAPADEVTSLLERSQIADCAQVAVALRASQ